MHGNRWERARAHTPLTAYAIENFNKRYKARFGAEPTQIEGVLADSNKLNFQREYVRLVEAGADHDTAALEAVKRISFGVHRMNAGYTDLDVTAKRFEYIDLGPELGPHRVPTAISVTATRP